MCNGRPARFVESDMGSLFRCVVLLGVVAGLSVPASAQGQRCSQETLALDGFAVVARFCIPAGAGAPSVSVIQTFSALGKTIEKTTPLAVVAGAVTSRTIDDVDLTPIGPKRSLHMTLAFRAGSVVLEHALALPGAIPLK